MIVAYLNNCCILFFASYLCFIFFGH